MDNANSIKEYFRGKNVFVTGGSGFLGKALIEKLLRSCPNVRNIYILLRPKKGKCLQDRVQEILSSPVFDKLKETNPRNLDKIIPINGDVSKPELGLSKEDRALLIEQVHLFYNAAASVKFDDYLKYAIFSNVRSAREAATLALEMKKIEIFMHVSTTYCNIDNKKVVDECLYPSHGYWKDAIQVAETCDEQTLNVFSQKYIEGFPNTYTYTKRLAEHCINDLLAEKVSTIICRPSIVISTIADPFPGWIDNFNGPVGLLLAGGCGILRTVYADPTIDMDYMAVDNVIKILIVATWHKAHFGDKNDLSIYHASKYQDTLIKVSELLEYGKKLFWDIPFENKIWFPGQSIMKCWYNFFINVILFHMVPAFFLDIMLKLTGRSPMLVKIQRKIYIANMSISHFSLSDWSFINTKAMKLYDTIPHKEVADFDFKIMPVGDDGVYNYYLESCNHARQYLLKEPKDISYETRVRTRRMYYLDRTIKVLFFAWTLWIIFFKVDILKVFSKMFSNYWKSL